jgi:hypothetical protein
MNQPNVRIANLITIFSLCSTICLGALPSSVMGQSAGTFLRVKQDVRLRADASTDSDVVFYLKKGEVLEVIERAPKSVKLEGNTDYWYKVRTYDSFEGWSFGSYLDQLDDSALSRFPALDTTTLPTLMADKDYDHSPHFKALVVKISGTPEAGFTFTSFDFNGTSRHFDNWWPASNVKIFPAAALLQLLSQKGFGPAARLTFLYEGKSYAVRLKKLISRAITHSKNRSYDQTVEATGCKNLNTRFFTPTNGIRHTVLMRSYTHRVVIEGTDGEGSTRHSPSIKIRQGDEKVTIPEVTDHTDYSSRNCGGIDEKNQTRPPDKFQGNCTTLRDLSEVMRRIMMQERLPKHEQYAISADNVALLRAALAGDRARGNNIIDGLKKGMAGIEATFYHKPGYAMKWMSDVVYVDIAGTEEDYIVAMANHPGRTCLDDAARIVGELINEGAFR